MNEVSSQVNQGGTSKPASGGATAKSNSAIPGFFKKEINGDKAAYQLERLLEPDFKIDREGGFTLSEYGSKIGFADGLPEGLTYNDKPLRGGDYVTTTGKLSTVEREIERAAEKKARIEEKLSKVTDTKKGEGLTLKRDQETHKRELESKGKDAQRQVHDLRKDLERHREGLDRAFDEKVELLRDHKAALHDTINDLKIEDNQVKGFEGLGDHKIEVKVRNKKYELSSNGIKVDGNNAPLDAQELKDIQHHAKEAVSGHVDTHEAVLKRAHEKAVGVVDQKLSHLDGLKSKISEKTGVGEWTGHKASVMTAGGAKAGSLMSAGEYEKATKWGKMKAETKANFGAQGKTGMKFVRGAVSLLGVIGVLDAGKKIGRGLGVFSPKTDETGKEVPAGAGDLMVGLGEGALSLGAVYLALTRGGKAKITGR